MEILSLKEDYFLEAVEYSEKTLVFQFPNIKLNTGNLVSIQCLLQMNETIPFPITGKIISCKENEEKTGMRVQIDLRQFDKNLWSKFLKLCEQEQDRADRLFAAIKGDKL
jgi:hypothetical protein